MASLAKFLLPALLVLSTQVWAFPQAKSVPGGISLVPLGSVQQPQPQAYFQNKRVTVLPYQQQWVAVVGLPLELAAGQYALAVYPQQTQPFTYPLQVYPKAYRTQRLRIRDQNKVTPDEASSERIVREMRLTDQLRRVFSPTLPNLNFIRPVKGRDTGRFGMRRIMNGKLRQPHSGMDLASPTGTPIRSPQSGRVIYTGSLFYTGNTVLVDHGQGVITLYAHLSRFDVRTGQTVAQGQVLGRVGQTGRATGPHLHWSVYLNQTSVDPKLFLN